MFAWHRTFKVKPALLLALAFSLLLAVPASADPPLIETGTWEDVYMPFDPQVCPGIEVWDHEVLTYRQTTYFDNESNVAVVDAMPALRRVDFSNVRAQLVKRF